MKGNKNIKEHLRIIIFALFVVILTVYLGIDTLSKPQKGGGGAQIVVPDVTEPDDTEPDDEVSEDDEIIDDDVVVDPSMPDVDPDQTIGTVFKENRTEFVNESVDEIDGHKKIVSSDSYDLYLKEENLSIILRNKVSGAVIYSTVEKPDKTNEKWSNFVKSGVVIEYLQDTNIVYYQADMYSENPNTKVTLNAHGFSAHVQYPSLEFEYKLEVSLKDDVLTTHIPKDSIIEKSDKYKVANVYVYPMMGYTKMDEVSGYMFVPDGSGSLIHYEDHKGQFKQPFNQMIYGSNIGVDDNHVLSLFNGMKTVNENTGILMPVFGSIHEDKNIGFVGIINQGDESARLYAYPNGAVTPYNWITPSFVYRQFYNQLTSATTGTMVIRQKELNNFDIEIEYHLLSDESASYVGMAQSYREYLEDHNLISQKDTDYSMRVDFLGTEVKSGLLKKQNVTMTTFEDMKEILETLKSNGVKNTLSTLKGWQDGGPYTKLPAKNFNTANNLGDIDVLKSLDQSQQVSLETDLLRYNPSTNSLNSATLVKKLNKRTYEEEIYGKVYKKYNYIVPEESLSNAEDILKQYTSKGFDSLSITGVGETLFSYLNKNKPYDRIHTASVYTSIFEKLNEANMNITAKTPHAIYWNYVDKLSDIQVDSSNYVFTGEEVPFLPIVLKSYMPMYAPYTNFNANHEAYVLNMIEYGTFPSFIITGASASELQLTNSSELYSTQFDLYKDQIIKYNEIFESIDQVTNGQRIINHERVDDVVVVSYENDVKIVLNYGDDASSYEGHQIQAMDYEVIVP